MYKIQIGAYKVRDNAIKMKDAVIKAGFKAVVIQSDDLYKVQAGAYSVKENAEKQLAAIKKAGFNAVMINVEEGPAVDVDQPHPKIRVWGIWFFEKNEKLFGDATAIIQYNSGGKPDHVVLIDTGMAAGQTVAKLKAVGVKVIDAVVISHAHGDHYGALTDVFKNFTVKHLYLPDTTQLDKYQKTYGNALRSQASKAKKYGAGCTYMKAGSSFTVGKIRCDCIYQAPAAALSEHDSHYFVNNESIVLRFTLDGIWKYHTAGDLQNPANNLLVKAVKDLKADIFKFQWHGDANAINTGLMEAIRPKIAFSNYHHKERSGRSTTRKRAEAVGAVVARNAENGDIYIDCEGNKMKLSCSKGNLSKTFVK